MRKKKWLQTSLAVITAATFILAGCSNNEPKGSNTETGRTNGEVSTDPVSYDYFAFGTNKDVIASNTTIGKILQEQTGVDWKMEYVVGDASTKSGVMIAGGDYPDVISPVSELSKLTDAGAFIPLNDLIEKYAPNIKRVYGDYMDKITNEDGNIYILPFTANVNGYLKEPDATSTFWMQRRVLKEFGYPEVKTLDQYFDLIEQYQAKYPSVDGKGTIGFLTFAGTAGEFFTITNQPMHLAGYPNDGNVMVDMKTQEAKLYMGTDYEKRWLAALNEMNRKSLLDPETFTANKDQYLAKLTSGRVLGYVNYSWQIGDATNNLKAAGNDDLRYVALPIVFDENTTDAYIDPPSFVNNRGLGITVSAEDPIRIIKYWDNLLSEENQKLIQWGEKDVTYSVNEEGRFVMSKEQLANRNDNEFKRKYGWAYFDYEWPRYGNNSLYEDGNAHLPTSQPEVAEVNYTDGDLALLKAYGLKTFSDFYAEPVERPWYPAWSIEKEQGSPEQIFNQKAGDLQQKYYPKMVFSSEADFESIWNDYLAEFNKLKPADFEQFITSKVKERIAGNW
ncbi:putative aldouronate transport system substrate-binding protein [Paenibacillus endophyticus]|uniref:Putative aldouronate transport system substrate-binding protein n=1 Tax=Paenibacillus endophyticus TaxID=1294268 RepID=A0A7W5C4E6_9BACL|nr:ABC transporter substrate-binding protein [Paenibacillus endophyticus]MBB3150464.1 putative aldouronate transport system substrate-binding protein [Paenibacillus endophyticus]